jgi:hypothetical protein
MAHSKYIPNSSPNPVRVIMNERRLLEKHYDFLHFQKVMNKLVCLGHCRPSFLSICYTYKVDWVPGQHPMVFPVKPKIEYDEEIHMYPKSGSLCLYYVRDHSWTGNSHIYNTIIPWTHEWFMYYELYKIHGRWLHPSVSHRTDFNQP